MFFPLFMEMSDGVERRYANNDLQCLARVFSDAANMYKSNYPSSKKRSVFLNRSLPTYQHIIPRCMQAVARMPTLIYFYGSRMSVGAGKTINVTLSSGQTFDFFNFLRQLDQGAKFPCVIIFDFNFIRSNLHLPKFKNIFVVFRNEFVSSLPDEDGCDRLTGEFCRLFHTALLYSPLSTMEDVLNASGWIVNEADDSIPSSEFESGPKVNLSKPIGRRISFASTMMEQKQEHLISLQSGACDEK